MWKTAELMNSEGTAKSTLTMIASRYEKAEEVRNAI